MKRKKGEALTVLLVAVAGAFIVGTFIPQINPANWFKTTPNTYNANWDRGERTSTPKVAVFDDGKVAVFNETKESYDKGSEKTTPKLTIMQQFGNWISNLSFFWFVILGFLLAAGVVTPAGIFAWSKHVWKSAFKNTVAGIREMPDKEAYEKVTTSIAKKQDRRDKKLVDKVKANLH